MTFKKLLLSATWALIGHSSIAQVGFIKGRITDFSNGETIPGAKIIVDSINKGSMSDLDGVFTIALRPGTYSLGITYPSYRTLKVKEIFVNTGDTTILNIKLEKEVKEVKSVTVKGQVNRESNVNLIQLQKNAASTIDGISSETIKKSPDRSAGDVLKRVSGASVQDNKFVIIRGLNDRYNTAMINGLPLPSTEADRKAFSFDIFPSYMLDNMLIYKTSSPDLPGDFAGGVIQINTKEIPEKDYFSFTLGSGLNTQSTFKEFVNYNGSKNDWRGAGIADRSMPSDIPATDELKKLLNNSTTRFQYSNLFANDWELTNKASSPLNQSYQLAFAKSLKQKENSYGVTGGLNYNYTRRFFDVTRRDFNTDSSRLFDYNDKTYRENVMLGAMFNFVAKLGDHTKLSFKNMYSNQSEDAVIMRDGRNVDADQIIAATAIQYTSNQLFSSQLSGEHLVTKRKIKARWGLNYSNTQTIVPNLKRMLYYKNGTPQETAADSIYTAYVPFGVPSPDFAGRFFSDLNENLYSALGEISVPYNMLNETSVLKFGYAGSIKNRTFDARVFGYAVNSPAQFNYNLLYLPQNEIFAEENIKVQGFKLGETTNPSDSYTAGSSLHAGYVMTDQKFGQKLRAVYGLRVEQFNQQLNSSSYGGDTLTVDNSNLSYLPSINFTYSPFKRSNFRIAASKTVARPDFRELAPFSFYDFNTSSAVVGNDTLLSTDIINLDLRYEFFAGNGQLLSTSVFYKDFNNPIENTVFFGGSGSRTYTYQNVTDAVDYGIELEWRTKLGGIDSLLNTSLFDQFTFFTNLTYVKSIVDLSNVATAVTEEEKFRPMQGQSPYLINSGLMYQNDELGLGVNIMFNRIGRRIAFVGTNGYQDIYENPRNVFDIQLSKRIFKKGEIKFNASDLFNNYHVFYQDFNRSGRYEAEQDKQITGIKYGVNLSLSFAYKF
jgi:outer membrane receptor protein involved in Fe transport